jgi:tetratricopeptide (TPR) repeat protein
MSDYLQLAMEHHRAGRLDLAEALYRKMLADEPDHADVWHLLGVLVQERGNPAQAIAYIERALALQPESAAYHVNLGEIHRATGNIDKGIGHFRTALRLDSTSAEALNNLGLALQQQGQFDEARDCLERALEKKPLALTPYLNLGKLLRGQGKIVEALAIFREGVRLIPDAWQLHGPLGRMLLDLGRAGEAIPHLQEAARLHSEPESLCDLAEAFHGLGRAQEAEACCRQAIQLGHRPSAIGYRPEDRWPTAESRWPTAESRTYHLLGQILQQQGRPAQAIDCYRQALGHDPYSLKLHCDLGSALYDNEQSADAVAHFRLVTKLHPQQAEPFNGLGYLLQDQGDTAGAIAAYREAIRLKPDYADAYLNLGLALTEMGELIEAQQAFRQALRYDPNHAESYAALALALRDKLPQEDLAVINELLASGKVTGKKRAVLQFGLVQTLDAKNQFAEAAEQARQANVYFKEHSRGGQGFDPAEHRAYVSQIIAAYTPAHFERVRGWGLDSDLPVFVLGLPRSGTSLVEQILASHPQVFGAGELNLMRDCYRAIPGLVGKKLPGIECVGDLDRDMVDELARRYLDGLKKLNATAVRIVDKMPDNYLMLGLIATLFPRARIIHTRRDLGDVALSCWLTFFKHIQWSFDLEHIGVRIREYVRLMKHWRRVLPVPMLDVNYEETVADLEGMAKRLVSWCGLEWDPACLEFHKTKRPVRTASMIQVREPAYTRSVGRRLHYPEVFGVLERHIWQDGEDGKNIEKN